MTYYLRAMMVACAAWLSASAALAHLGVGPHVHPHPGSGTRVAGLRLLEHSRRITVADDASAETHVRLLYLLESREAAAAFANILYSYNPVLSPRLEVKVRLLRRLDSGETIEVKGAVQVSRKQATPRTLVPTIEAKVTGTLPGDVVEIVIDKKSLPLMPGRFFAAVPLAYDVPTQRLSIELRAPARMVLTTKVWGPRPETNIVTDGDTAIRTWSYPQGVAGWQPKPGGWVRPVLMIATPTTWEDVRRWLSQKFLSRMSASSDVKSLAEQLAGRYDDYMQKLDAIAKFVSGQIANRRFEVGEEAYVPRQPERVLKAKTGDCKDKAVLMASLLRAAGLVPHLALTCLNYTLPPLSQMPPNPYVFDHVVVGVSGPGNTVWLDPTGRAVWVRSFGHPLQAMFLDVGPARFFPIRRFRPIYDVAPPKL